MPLACDGADCFLTHVARAVPSQACPPEAADSSDVTLTSRGAFLVDVNLRDPRFRSGVRAEVEILDTPVPPGAVTRQVVTLQPTAEETLSAAVQLVWPRPGSVRIRVRGAGRTSIFEQHLVASGFDLAVGLSAATAGLRAACATVSCRSEPDLDIANLEVGFASVPALTALPTVGRTDASGAVQVTLALPAEAPEAVGLRVTLGAQAEACDTAGLTGEACGGCPARMAAGDLDAGSIADAGPADAGPEAAGP